MWRAIARGLSALRRTVDITPQEFFMPRTRLLVGAVALALAATSVNAQRFSGVVAFGDSLSDGGNIGLVPAAAGGLGGAFGPSQSFTTNPDPVLVELLARRFGATLNPSLIPGGRNYAWGGACALSAVASTCNNNPNPITRLDAQIGQYLAGGSVPNPNALHTVWIGANDLFQRIPVWAANPATAAANAQVGVSPLRPPWCSRSAACRPPACAIFWC